MGKQKKTTIADRKLKKEKKLQKAAEVKPNNIFEAILAAPDAKVVKSMEAAASEVANENTPLSTLDLLNGKAKDISAKKPAPIPPIKLGEDVSVAEQKDPLLFLNSGRYSVADFSDAGIKKLTEVTATIKYEEWKSNLGTIEQTDQVQQILALKAAGKLTDPVKIRYLQFNYKHIDTSYEAFYRAHATGNVLRDIDILANGKPGAA